MDELGRHLAQWSAAGVIDEETAARIRAFERERAGPPGLAGRFSSRSPSAR
jgi:hypothetical protein